MSNKFTGKVKDIQFTPSIKSLDPIKVSMTMEPANPEKQMSYMEQMVNREIQVLEEESKLTNHRIKEGRRQINKDKENLKEIDNKLAECRKLLKVISTVEQI